MSNSGKIDDECVSIEGSVVLRVQRGNKDDRVFYNPDHRVSRDIIVAAVFEYGLRNCASDEKKLHILEPFTGCGVRSLRVRIL